MTAEKIQSEFNIPLGNGKYAMIDLCDLDKIQGYSWNLKGRYGKRNGQVEYAGGFKTENGKHVSIYLHRLIWGEENIPAKMEVAHIDGNGFNCHGDNLKCVTRKQNAQGRQAKRTSATSIFRGVSKQKAGWRVCIFVEGKQIAIGKFDNEVDAAKAYDAAARRYFGAHAAPNFP